ncbi:MAG: OmpA family protein [Vitreoscilla sp.]|nr:OmpA family protein [Vitreoscilla sp.]
MNTPPTARRTLRLLGLAGLSAMAVTPVLAQDSYPYVGLSLGRATARIDEGRITSSLIGPGLSISSLQRDDTGMGYKVFGGYQMNRNFALEAGYFNLGKTSFQATTLPLGTLDGELKFEGINLDLVGTVGITERLSGIGRVGAQYARTRDSFSGTGAVLVTNPNPGKNETNLKYGLGLQYAFSPSFMVRAEAESYRVNDAVGRHGDVAMYSVGLVFPFGRAAEPRAQAPAPYVAMAPAPAPPPPPVVAPAPPPPPAVVAPPVRRRVSFEAESLFGFDKTALQPAGKAALDNFARELQGTQFDVVSVEGHTDRLGSTAYNEALSQQRAEAVKAYLVSDGKVDAAKVSAVGLGEGSPMTQVDACKGNAPSAKLIACLQPDRRVEIEVVGTR